MEGFLEVDGFAGEHVVDFGPVAGNRTPWDERPERNHRADDISRQRPGRSGIRRQPLRERRADGSACGHLPCSPWEDQTRFVRHQDAGAGWHVLFIEYRPGPAPAVAFCLDGSRLAKGGMAEALAGELADLLAAAGATQPLRLRVSANVEGEDPLQQVEVDWFALQGRMQ